MLFLYAMNVHLFVPTTKIRLFVGISSYSCHKETKKVVCAWKYYGIKKTLLWIGASLRLYTDVFEDLIIFGTILYSLCLLYLFHATLINSYMLYSFQPFHPQFFRCSAFSGPPYFLDKRFL